LIVEDHAPTRQALGRMFARAGNAVIEAATVAEALAGLDPAPGCVVLDLRLPDGNGEAVLLQIRRSGMPIPVVVMTGVSDPVLLSRVRTLRPELLIGKPIDPDVIVRLCAWGLGDGGD
jgi:DNA-binding NarL/FixJ family response regulator